MTNLLGILFVAFIIVLGFGTCWAITMHGSTAPVVQDSFGNVPSVQTNQSNSNSAEVATGGMALIPAAFFLTVLAGIAVAFVWLARQKPGMSKSKYY